jgi:hypothetical protein
MLKVLSKENGAVSLISYVSTVCRVGKTSKCGHISTNIH